MLQTPEYSNINRSGFWVPQKQSAGIREITSQNAGVVKTGFCAPAANFGPPEPPSSKIRRTLYKAKTLQNVGRLEEKVNNKLGRGGRNTLSGVALFLLFYLSEISLFCEVGPKVGVGRPKVWVGGGPKSPSGLVGFERNP